MPQAFVETFGGDRLPGRVIASRQGNEIPHDHLPAHLEVRIESERFPPGWLPREVLRIKTDAVKKVVWQRKDNQPYTPATLFSLAGRRVDFHSLRWNLDRVDLLLKEGGIRTVAFAEIAELHLPARHPWEVYHETLAVLCPDLSARLLRLETTGRLLATTSMKRFQASGDYHLIQPAWALDPIWVRQDEVLSWLFFWPWEVPLSLLEPSRALKRSALGGIRDWQADRNIQQRTLRSGAKVFGWGIGTHAYCELEFELPTAIRSFRAQVGLDEEAADGGCARGLVHVNHVAEPPLWKSKLLIGSREVVDTGILALKGPEQGQKCLILVADPAASDCPPGADPLNLHDMVDWLEPQLVLDVEKLRQEVNRFLPKTIPAWQNWTPSFGKEGRLAAAAVWDNPDLNYPGYRAAVTVRNGTLILSRRLQLAPEQKYLCLMLVTRTPSATAAPLSSVEVRVDGKPLARFDVPVPQNNGLDPSPRLLPLEKFQGQPILLEVAYSPGDDQAFAEWRSLDLVEYPEFAPWSRLDIVASRSAAESVFKMEEHTIIVKNMPKARATPMYDTYTIVADTPLRNIKALRLDVLPDNRFPGLGAGRGDGHVFLSSVKITAAPRQNPANAVPVTLASADAFRTGHPPASTLDDLDKTGWTPSPRGEPHVVVFAFAQNIGFPGGTRLTITLDHKVQAQRSIGRFQLSVTGAGRPAPLTRPPVILQPPGP